MVYRQFDQQIQIEAATCDNERVLYSFFIMCSMDFFWNVDESQSLYSADGARSTLTASAKSSESASHSYARVKTRFPIDLGRMMARSFRFVVRTIFRDSAPDKLITRTSSFFFFSNSVYLLPYTSGSFGIENCNLVFNRLASRGSV